MANEFYTASGNPGTGSSGSSSVVRSEFTSLEQAFDKLPTMTGSGGEFVRVNAGGNALETTAYPSLVTLGGITPGAEGLLVLEKATGDEVLTEIGGASVLHANWLGTAGGTANALTLTPSPAIAAYAAGQTFRFLSSAANTGAATVNVSGLGVKTIKRPSGIDLQPDDITSGCVCEITYDGTNFELISSSKNETSRIFKITASVGSNALTVTLSPTVLDFRSYPLTSGTVNTRVVSSNISVTAPSGATLGLTGGMLERIIVYALDNAGTVELALALGSSGQPIDESGVISTTAIDVDADIDEIYSTTARTNVPYRVVGYLDIQLTTPGTWDAAPTVIQGAGGMALAKLSGIGNDQTWQALSGSRSLGVTYYNTTGKSIQVHVVASSSTTSPLDLTIGGITIRSNGQASVGASIAVSGIVPPGTSYTANVGAGTGSLIHWQELR